MPRLVRRDVLEVVPLLVVVLVLPVGGEPGKVPLSAVEDDIRVDNGAGVVEREDGDRERILGQRFIVPREADRAVILFPAPVADRVRGPFSQGYGWQWGAGTLPRSE